MSGITAWRIVSERFTVPPFDPLDGEGAKTLGGRWNAKDVPMVYLSGAVSLAILEVLVHSGKLDQLASKVMLSVSFRPEDVRVVEAAELTARWFDDETAAETRRIGDEWVRSTETPILKVPSAVLPVEFNYLLNPAHPHFARIRATATAKQKLPLDPRLLQMS